MAVPSWSIFLFVMICIIIGQNNPMIMAAFLVFLLVAIAMTFYSVHFKGVVKSIFDCFKEFFTFLFCFFVILVLILLHFVPQRIREKFIFN